MAIRHLTKAEVNTLLIKLTLAGFIPGKDFKVDENGRIWARKEIYAFISRIPALPEADDDFVNDDLTNDQQRPLMPTV
ncbi:MAG: hypothetical protein AAF921_15310 [Cyanobacteria bacterium P01_D01_bin.44]